MNQTLFKISGWQVVKDGDAQAFDLYRRHYSFNDYQDGRRQNRKYRNRFLIAGPGQKLVLLHTAGALFVWRKFIDKSGQEGVNCAVFRNESNILSSELILQAEKIAWRRWPEERLYTYVNSRKISSSNPGYCFQKAGWQKCGITKALKLIILEKSPHASPLTHPSPKNNFGAS
jgi:hypothetical protein